MSALKILTVLIAMTFLILGVILFPTTYSPGAGEKTKNPDRVFVDILKAAYRVSCDDVERLRDYYLPEADIVHDGRQTSLDETIDELRRAMDSSGDLSCAYTPRVRTQRVENKLAYLLVRESLRISSPSMGDQRIEQLCTYIFLNGNSRWKIALDHCSTIRGSVA